MQHSHSAGGTSQSTENAEPLDGMPACSGVRAVDLSASTGYSDLLKKLPVTSLRGRKAQHKQGLTQGLCLNSPGTATHRADPEHLDPHTPQARKAPVLQPIQADTFQENSKKLPGLPSSYSLQTKASPTPA